MRRPLLLGIDNPHSANPRAALLPRPPGSAGGRLLAMSGMPWSEYRLAFDRVNACDVRAHQTQAVLGDRWVLILGRQAWRMVRMLGDGVFFREEFSRELCSTVVLVPHPSGRNHFYNEEKNRERLGALLRRVRAEHEGSKIAQRSER